MDQPLLKIENLRKVYRLKRGRQVCALDGVSTQLETNRVVALLGQNGSGKTTFIKACCNLITFDGSVRYAGRALRRSSNSLNSFYAAVLEGNRNIYWKLTVMENIRYFAALRYRRYRDVRPLAEELLRRLNMFS